MSTTVLIYVQILPVDLHYCLLDNFLGNYFRAICTTDRNSLRLEARGKQGRRKQHPSYVKDGQTTAIEK